MCRRPVSVPRRRFCGDRAWRTEGASGCDEVLQPHYISSHIQTPKPLSAPMTYLPGNITLLLTLPVSISAAFTTPSLPAENNTPPSALYANALQLPLCLRVLHTVSMVSNPLSDSLRPVESMDERVPVPLVRGGAVAESLETEGRRKVCTTPDARPTVKMGAVGCVARAKMSALVGRLQMLSNISCDLDSRVEDFVSSKHRTGNEVEQ